MTFFYIALYTLELIAVCCRLYITIYLINEMVKCAKRTHKYEGGLLALQTPWGMDKSPECTQLMSIKMTLALPNLWCYAGTLYCAYITAMCHPGFGLLSSVPTGKLYFGSKWNEYPLMDRDYYTENYFGWHLIIFCSFIVGHNMPIFANLSGLLMVDAGRLPDHRAGLRLLPRQPGLLRPARRLHPHVEGDDLRPRLHRGREDPREDDEGGEQGLSHAHLSHAHRVVELARVDPPLQAGLPHV